MTDEHLYNEVSAVDKYEYKLQTQKMLELMEKGEYRKAATIADTIDWNRVRNSLMLTNVSDIYEKTRDYQKSYAVLKIAYSRAESSRKVICRLCTLALKTGNSEEAIDFYDEFIQIAPKDPNRHILRYQILRAQGAPVEQQIEALEEFKKAEYIEKWAYELAKLYQEAGKTTECLEECDDLILWFSEGKYVYKAMELKKQYKPLTPSQQEKYDHRYPKQENSAKVITADTEEMPNLDTYLSDEKKDNEEVQPSATEEPVPEETQEKTDLTADTIAIPQPLEEQEVPEEAGEAVEQERIPVYEEVDSLEEEPAEETVVYEETAQEIPEEQPAVSDDRTVYEEYVVESEPEEEEEIINTATETVESSGTEDTKPAESIETESEKLSEAEAQPEKKKIGDTMRLDEALKQLLHPEAIEETVQVNPNVEPDISDLEADINDIESIADLGMVNQIEQEKKEKMHRAVPSGMKELLPTAEIDEEEELTTDSAEISEEAAEEFEEVLPNVDDAEELMDFGDLDLGEAEEFLEEAEESADLTAEDSEEVEDLTDSEELDLADILEDWEPTEDTDLFDTEDAEPLEEAEDDLFADAEELDDDLFEEVEPEVVEEAEDFEDAEIPDEEYFEADDAEEFVTDTEEFDLDDAEEVEPELQDAESFDEEAAEEDSVPEKKASEPILPPDIQRMIDEIEGVIPTEEEEPVVREEVKEKVEEPHENMGKLADELRIDDLPEEDEDDWGEPEEFDEDLDEAYSDEYDESFDEGDDDFSDYEEDSEYEEEYDEPEAYSGSDEDFMMDDDGIPDFEEEFRVNPKHSEEIDDREIPENDDGIDIMSATTPLSRKETAKLIATGKTAPLPLDEISSAMSLSDTGFIVHGRYDLEMQSGIGTRAGLTEEQKKLFSYFVPVRGMSEQLVDVLEQDKNCTNRRGTSRTGNLLIIGNKGNGKTVLAVDVVKAIQKQRNIRQGKVAIVTGESLNKKKIGDIFRKLYGGALIIEKAGKLNEKTVARLNKAMEQNTGELLIVLEEQRKPLDRLLSSNREFRRKFTSRLEVPIFINDELVTFGQTYAQENGYRIDEMGILALYSKIDSLQREDHAVTVAEVKDVMDEAIQHSQKASAKKLVRRVFGKNTDSADRIFLTENDFNI